MPDPNVLRSGLALLLAALGPATNPFERWAYRPGSPLAHRLLGYGAIIALLWLLAGAAVWLDGWPGLLEAPGAMTAWLAAPAVTAPVLSALALVFFAVAFMPLIQSLRGPRRRRAYAAAIRREFARIPGFLPDSAAQHAGWVVLSLTAGVTEEVLFRGFLIRFLHEGAPALPLAGALAASCLLFGLGHIYQGLKGAAATSLGGLAFGLLFLLSGSLIPCIVLHALMDLQVGYVLRPGAHDADAPEAGLS